MNDFSPPVDLLDSLHRCRQSRFLCNNEDRTKKERQISNFKITTIAFQESRKEHGSLQELPCSPVKEREEVIMMMMLIIIMMIILLISINVMITMANALIP